MSEQVVDRLSVVLEGHSAPFVNMLENAEQRTQQTADKLVAIGTKMTLALSTTLGAISAYSLKTFADFEDNITKSTAIMAGITPQIKRQMEDVAMSMSTVTVTSAHELAEAYYFLASAGLDAKQSMDALGVVNNFAIAGNFDMAKATDLVTDAQSALGLTVKDSAENMANMARVSDVLIKANTLANASAEQFATSLTTKSAAALRGLNKDIEEGVAVLAAYADQGVKGQLAGEKLTIMLRETQVAANKNSDEWAALGLSIYDSSGNMLPIVDILRQLEGATNGMSDAQTFATFTSLGFRSESMDAIKPLLGLSDKIADYETKLRSAGGVTEEVAGKQMVSFSAQLKIFRNNVASVAYEIGQILAPSVLKLNEYINMGLNGWKSLNEETKIVLVALGKITAVMGPVLVSFGMFARFAPVMAGQWAAMTANIMNALTWLRTVGLVAALPFIKVIAVIAAVSAAVYALAYLIVGPEGLSAAWTTAGEFMHTFFNSAIGFLANFTTNIGIAVDWLKNNWKALVYDMAMAWLTMTQNNISNILTVIGTMVRLYVAFGGWLYEYIPKLFQYIFSEEFAIKVYEGIVAAVKAFSEFGKQVWEVLKAAFNGLSTLWMETNKAMFGVTMDFAKAIGKMFAQVLKGEFPNPAELMDEFMQRAEARLKVVSFKVGEAVGAAGEIAAEKLQQAQDQIVSDFNKGASDVNFFNTAADIIGEGFDNLKGPLDGFESSISELPKFVMGVAADLDESMEGAGEAIEDQVEAPLKRVETQAMATAAAVGKISEGIDGLAMSSLASAIKIDSYFEGLTQAATDATTATARSGDAVAAQTMTASTTPKTTQPEQNATVQRTTMITLLQEIRDRTSVLEGANI